MAMRTRICGGIPNIPRWAESGARRDEDDPVAVVQPPARRGNDPVDMPDEQHVRQRQRAQRLDATESGIVEIDLYVAGSGETVWSPLPQPMRAQCFDRFKDRGEPEIGRASCRERV